MSSFNTKVKWKGLWFDVSGYSTYEPACFRGHPDNWTPDNSEFAIEEIKPEDESLVELIEYFNEKLQVDESFEEAVLDALRD